MIDMVKVVDGLICCSFITEEKCRSCPYHGDDIPASCYVLKEDAKQLRQFVEKLQKEDDVCERAQ